MGLRCIQTRVMGKRRHFIISFAGMALLMLLACGLWPRGLAIEEEQSQTILRLWLAADYHQALEDPALRTSTAGFVAGAARIGADFI